MTTGYLHRLRESYRIKQLTDTSFYATVVAVKCFLFAIVVIVVAFIALKEGDFPSTGSRPAPKAPVFHAP
jgi:hypothetical protein